MRKSSQPIGFRLPGPYAQRLRQEAARHGLSAGAYARLLVVEALADADRLRLLDEVAELRRAVGRLHENLGIAVVALLSDAGKAEAEEARAFVRDHFTR